MRKIIVRLLREPLLHFVAVGGLVFAVYANRSELYATSPDVISISETQIEQLTAQFSSVWNRPPSDDELDVVIEAYIREEVYYREALALGFDQNDVVVRQRLRQKMEFMTDTGAQLLVPTTAELEAYRGTNESRARPGARRAIEQVYLGQTPPSDRIADLLKELQSEPDMNTSTIGERTLLPAELGLSLPEDIDSVYGSGFFEQIKEVPVGQWAGPVVSAYGVHLVRVLDNRAGQAPPLAEVRAALVREWQAEKAKELRELDYAARRDKYVIQIDGR